MIPKFSAAMFDVDGTLLSSMRYWRLTTLEYMLQKDVIPTEQELGRLFYTSGRGLLEELIKKYELPCDWEKVFRSTEGFMLRHYREDVQAKPGTAMYLATLKQRGIPMCVGTASLKEFVVEALDRLELTTYFDFVTDNRELCLEKDDPEYFRVVAERLGVSPEQMCVFEDAPYAIRGAKAAGCPVIGILDPTQQYIWDEVAQLSDITVRDYEELLQMIARES